jgi:hypothetical protein
MINKPRRDLGSHSKLGAKDTEGEPWSLGGLGGLIRLGRRNKEEKDPRDKASKDQEA